MELWYSESAKSGLKLNIRIKSHLLHRETEFQTVDVFETQDCGKMLVIDGCVMLTEMDEFVYHECITHVPLQLLKSPRKVLIVGGGDGGSAREVLKYPSVEEVVMVELDREVIQVSKEIFPGLSGAFKDSRLRVVIQDGAGFVKRKQGLFDLIIIDSTDPVGPGEVLFSREFYRDCHTLLNAPGILTAQTESPFDYTCRNKIKRIYRDLGSVFKSVRMYLGNIPTYPFGLWSFALASDQVDPLRDEAGSGFLPEGLRCYNRAVAKSAFGLPNFIREIIHE